MDKILPLIEYGHLDFGENKVQEAIEKWSEIKKSYLKIKLHMIGKLQTNKVKLAVKLFDYIHSLDNLRLAEKISIEQKKLNKKINLFIQINIGNENQKNGLNPKELENFYKICVEKLDLHIVGLMCIPPKEIKNDFYFSEMRKLKSIIKVKELSMGMSEDFLTAIKYDASFLRIGTKIFGKRN